MNATKKAPRKAEASNSAPAADLQAKLRTIRDAVCGALVERDDEVDLALTAMIAREHLLLVGPPGVGKSLLLDTLVRAVSGAKSFNILMTKFTTPEEVFGPISVQGLKADQYRRITTSKLPEAHFALLDEIFKASSAINNTTLRILNERHFENGDGSFAITPLVSCMAGSNEYPSDDNGGKEQGAMFDRFLIRKPVAVVTKVGRKKLLAKAIANDSCRAVFPDPLTLAEVERAHREAELLSFSDDAKRALWDILEKLNSKGVFPGDRRIYKSIGVARAYAYLCGGSEVRPEHLEVLAHVLWDDPTEQPGICEAVVLEIANPIGGRAAAWYSQAVDVDQKQLAIYEAASGQADKDNACKFAISKLVEVQKELDLTDPTRGGERRARAVAFVQDAIKSWKRRSIGVSEEG